MSLPFNSPPWNPFSEIQQLEGPFQRQIWSCRRLQKTLPRLPITFSLELKPPGMASPSFSSLSSSPLHLRVHAIATRAATPWAWHDPEFNNTAALTGRTWGDGQSLSVGMNNYIKQWHWTQPVTQTSLLFSRPVYLAFREDYDGRHYQEAQKKNWSVRKFF